MMPFFPNPYEDELLYSIIARYHRLSGNILMRTSLQDLFGSGNVCSSVILPGKIGYLANQIPYGSISAGNLLLKYTLFPYYSAFQSQHIINDVLNWENGKNNSAIFQKLGIWGSVIKQPEYLRYCPQCYLEDIQLYCESYWRKLHQTPGVLVCPKHGCQLMNSTISYCSRDSHDYFSMNIEYLFPAQVPPTLTESDVEKATLISRDLEWLYANYDLVRSTFCKQGSFRWVYLKLLSEKGLATPHASLYLEKLTYEFKKYYGDDLLNIWGVNFDTSMSKIWIASMCRNTQRSFQPLRHVLLAQFLCGSLKEFISYAQNLDSNVVIKPYFYHDPENMENKLNTYRCRWETTCARYPNKCQNDIRKLIPAVYTWLFRHDNVWIKEHSPKKAESPINRTYIDWEEKDNKLSKEVLQTTKTLLHLSGKPVWITTRKIGNTLGCYGILEKHIQQLPKTQKSLECVTETREQYQFRRINWAISELEKNNEPIVMWRVMRLAGIRNEFWNEYWEKMKKSDDITRKIL